ncbi:hypothetical protein XB05_17900 [Xanthomonas arboricola]|nr:hypothetical protein XB05_17900 [Xanthomonas arboricola]
MRPARPRCALFDRRRAIATPHRSAPAPPPAGSGAAAVAARPAAGPRRNRCDAGRCGPGRQH